MSHKEWVRVSGPDLQPQHEKRMLLNSKILASGVFLDACKELDIKPTRRQARKFRGKTGIVYRKAVKG